jgi:hypothetical protein
VNSFRPKIFDAVTSICLSLWVLLSFFSAKQVQAEIPDQLAQVTLSSDFETVSPGLLVG